jgi:thiamine-phosphate pyrophosphorylase
MKTAMAITLPPVYPITPESLRGRALFAWVEELLAAGCRLLQYRRKEGPDAEALQDLKVIVGLAREGGASVIVDDRPDLCLLAGADGVHLGQEDLPPEEVRRFLPPSALIGLSTHSILQFEEALDAPVDYLALGPVFATSSKGNPDPVVPVSVQKEVLRRATKPVVAIGGITPAGAGELFARGFASVAVISYLERDPAAGFRAFLTVAP